MLTPIRKHLLIIFGLLMLGEMALLVHLLEQRRIAGLYIQANYVQTLTVAPTSSIPLRPRPSADACKENPLFSTISTVSTVGEMLQKFGPPEKVYKWRQGGPENLFMHYGYNYLYPSNGFDFVSVAPDRIYGNAEVIDPHFIPPLILPMNYLKSRVSSACYPPTTLETYEAQFPATYGEEGSHFGEAYVAWENP